MGIKGLIPFVENATNPGHVSSFKCQRVAIDVSCLLHRGIFGCVEKVAQGIETDFCIKYVDKFVKMFEHYECKVTLVFDGQPLPAKKEVNDSRKNRRESNLQNGNALLESGKRAEGLKILRQGIGVPRDITESTIKYYKSRKQINVIVAPYEADAQLAYLIQEDFVDVVVTQDSDLIVFNCQKIIFKLDQGGGCLVFDGSKLKNCFNRPLCDNFNFDVFRRICILSGCDYLEGGLNGVGLKKAEKFFAKTTLTDPAKFLPRVPGFLNLRDAKVDQEFIKDFIRAENTFKHQIVYDPKLRIQIPLTLYAGTNIDDYLNLNENLSQLSESFWYAGTLVDSERATQLANGHSHLEKTPTINSQKVDDDIVVVDQQSSRKPSFVSAPPIISSASSSSSSNIAVISTTQSAKSLSFNSQTSAQRFTQKRLSFAPVKMNDNKRRVLNDRNPVVITIPDDVDQGKREILNKLAKVDNGRLFETGERRSAPAKISFSTPPIKIQGLVTRQFNFSKKRQTQKSSLFVEQDAENQAPPTVQL